MIHNAEIHVTRADPAKHGGAEGFVYAIDWSGGRKRVYSRRVYSTRQQAASAAGLWLDMLESELRNTTAR